METARKGKRKSENNKGKPSKRSRSSSQKSKLNEEYEAQQALEMAQTTSLYDSSNELFENRRFCCLAISPAGRAISKLGSIKELLVALRDVVKAHDMSASHCSFLWIPRDIQFQQVRSERVHSINKQV